MARKTKEQAAVTRDEILDAAAIVFYEKGVIGATLEDIAFAAGVTRGAIYWHFENKLSLFKALHDRLYSSFIEQMLDRLGTEDAPPLERLETLCVQLLIELAQDKEKRRTLSIFYLKCDYSGELAPFLEQQSQRMAEARGLFSRFFSKAAQLGQLPDGADENLVALAFTCYLGGIVNEYLRAPGSFSLQTEAKGLMRQFFKTMSE